jgi:hypothetical protein
MQLRTMNMRSDSRIRWIDREIHQFEKQGRVLSAPERDAVV